MGNGMNLRHAIAALAVFVLHVGVIFALMRSLGTVTNETTGVIPISLTFLPTPMPPLPYLPQFGPSQFGPPPSAAPRLQNFAPPPEIVVPFVPPSSNAITVPNAERLEALGRIFGCTLERFDSLPMEEKLRCGPSLARSATQDVVPRVLSARESALRLEWAASLGQPPIAVGMPGHEVYGEWWQGGFWSMPYNSIQQKLMK